jgi:hypothetical protein
MPETAHEKKLYVLEVSWDNPFEQEALLSAPRDEVVTTPVEMRQDYT